MICTLVAGALMTVQASHLLNLGFTDGEYLKQVSHRVEYIIKHNIKVNAWPRRVDVTVNGGIGLLMDDGVFVASDDLIDCQ